MIFQTETTILMPSPFSTIVITFMVLSLSCIGQTNSMVNVHTIANQRPSSTSEPTNFARNNVVVRRSHDQDEFYNDHQVPNNNLIKSDHRIYKRNIRAPNSIMTFISSTTSQPSELKENGKDKDHHLFTKQTTSSTTTAIPVKTQTTGRSTTSNNTVQQSTDPCKYKNPKTETTVILCVLVSIIVIGFIGNVLILVVISRSKKLLRHPANLFIASLNACNIGVLVTCAPLKIHTTLHGGNFCFTESTQEFTCAFYNVIDLTFHICSVTHLFAISVERLMAIKSPFYHRTRVTRRFTFKVLGMVWMYSLFWVALSFIPWHDDTLAAKYTDSHKVHFVAEIGSKNLRVCVLRNRNYAIVLGVLAFILPIIIMAVLYLITLQNIFRPDAAFGGHRHRKNNNVSLITADVSLTRIHGRKKEAALTKTVAIICVSFFICWMPSIALTIVLNSSPTTFIPKAVLVLFLDILPAIPTCTFPIIYAKHYGKFGEELTNMRSSRQERILSIQRSF